MLLYFPVQNIGFVYVTYMKNMKVKLMGKVFKDALWNCVVVTIVQEYNNAMDELKDMNNDCYKWLKAIPYEHWTRFHFTD